MADIGPVEGVPHRGAKPLKWSGGILMTISLVAFAALVVLQVKGVLSAAHLVAYTGAGTAFLVGFTAFVIGMTLRGPPPPTQFGNEVAASLKNNALRIAATRIFHNPLRSFLELVVNSLDAMKPDHPVGKFGMGFLSILSFLSHEETNGCTIMVTSTYRKEDGSLLTHRIRLRGTPDAIEHPNDTQLDPPWEHTGTEVRILPNEGEFTERTRREIRRIIHDLDYYPHGHVLINERNQVGLGNEKLCDVTLASNMLLVKDQGPGITRTDAENNLLVPSISNKVALAAEAEPELVPPFPIERDHPELVIAIGGVIVVTIPVPSQSLLLNLPASTRLTLARNAIEVVPATRRYLTRLINASLEGDIDSEALVPFYEGLVAWEKHEAAIADMNLSSYLKRRLREKMNERQLLAVPRGHFDTLPETLRNQIDNTVPLHPELVNGNFQPFEERLVELAGEENVDTECVEGATVIYLPDDNLPDLTNAKGKAITSFGCRTLLFAPLSLKDSEHASYSIAHRAVTENKSYRPYATEVTHSPISHLYSARTTAIQTRPATPRDAIFIESAGGPAVPGNVLLGSLSNEKLNGPLRSTGLSFSFPGSLACHTNPILQKERVRFEWVYVLSKFGITVENPDAAVYDHNGRVWPCEEKDRLNALKRLLQLYLEGQRIFVPNFEGYDPSVWKHIEAFVGYSEHCERNLLAFFSSLVVHADSLSKNLTNYPDSKREWQDTFEVMLNSYHELLKKKDFHSYLTSTNSYLSPIKDDLLLQELFKLLDELKETPPLFKKVSDFIQEDLRAYCHSYHEGLIRNDSILRQITFTLTSPEIFSLQCLLQLCSKGLSKEIRDEILTTAANREELFKITYLLLAEELSAFCIPGNEAQESRRASGVRSLIQHSIRPSMDRLAVRDEIMSNDSGIVNVNPDAQRVAYLLNIDAEEAIATLDHFVEPAVTAALGEAQPYTSNRVIAALPTLDEGMTLPDYVQHIRIAEPNLDLQMINQCVEHGSERIGWMSLLIEGTQNAIDARADNVVYEVGIVHKREEPPKLMEEPPKLMEEPPKLMVAVKDDAGFPNLRSLMIDFLVPNYSRKNEEAVENVGEMGNGSFQIYRDAEMVTLKTKLQDTGEIVLHRIIPVRNEEGEVVDLRVKTTPLEADDDFTGTELRVLFRNQENYAVNEIEVRAINVREFLLNTIAMTNPRHRPNLVLEYNGNHIRLDGINRNINPIGWEGLEFYPMNDTFRPGQVLTAGYPFKNLSHFLREEKLLAPKLIDLCHKGWCLNIPSGGYEPVQSRTRLRLSDETRAHLKELMQRWVFLAFIQKEDIETLARYFPHLGEKHELAQMKLSRLQYGARNVSLDQADGRSLQDFFVNFKPPELFRKNFLERIEDGYECMTKKIEDARKDAGKALTGDFTREKYGKTLDELQKKSANFFNDWKKEQIEDTGSDEEVAFLQKIVFPWFESKIATTIQLDSFESRTKGKEKMVTPSSPEISRKGKGKGKEKVTHLEDIKEDLIQAASNVVFQYTTVYASHFMTGRAPSINFACEHNNAKAWFIPGDDQITINLAYVRLSDILRLGDRAAQRQPINDPMLKELVKMLNHELFHAKLGNSHLIDLHPHGRDADGNHVSFNERAESFARRAAQAGLYDAWADALKPCDPELLQELIQFEANDPLETARKLGSK